jgi:hypothetical protein
VTPPTPDELRDAVDEVSIRALISTYADVVNRRAWPELTELVVADAPITIDLRDRPAIEIVGPVALGEFIGGAIERFAFFEFVALNVHVERRVDTDVDHAAVRTYMCELRQDHDGAPSRAFGLYQDAVARTAGGWRFARRSYQSMGRGEYGGGAGLDLMPLPVIDGPGSQ